MYYSQKVIISGQFLEVYTYQSPQKKDFSKEENQLPENKEKTSCQKDRFSLSRTRNNIRRIINANPDFNRFVTLTFADQCSDIDQANKHFKQFIQRLRYDYPNFKYLAVVEYQKDYDYYGRKKERGGAVHYHCLFNNKRFSLRVIDRYWSNGFVDSSSIRHVGNVGAYVCKYLTKEIFDIRFFGKKKFFVSRNVNRPEEFHFETDQSKIIKETYLLNEPIYSKKFDNPYSGNVQYQQYRLPAH